MGVIKATIYKYACDNCGTVAEYPNVVRPVEDGWVVAGGESRTPRVSCPNCEPVE